ncbi:uncharacterized protein LOC117901876 [Drosophila subobscura]|uniref:uncharacterized protein LOC117901876 n=1 Tax=Drosophila subobscura TaxID=7241 RepID=UPI00155A4937|nr:uncharacterized protein LOC117901876 [Drosophila subobscura]
MCHSHRRLSCSDINEKFSTCFQWSKLKCPPPDQRLCDVLQRRGFPRTAEDCRWHYWSHRNDVVIQQLAKLLKGCPEKVAGFLFDLTLQNYNRLLHPKRCGYNACHVPYCHPYVCERYKGIFDEYGNLRDPTHPRSLFKLLEILQNFLKGETSGCVPLPFDSSLKKAKQKPLVGYQVLRPMTAARCYGMDSKVLKEALGPGYQRTPSSQKSEDIPSTYQASRKPKNGKKPMDL